jgi:hypothetical protein
MIARRQRKLIYDLIIVVFSIFIAVLLAATGTLDAFIKLFNFSYLLTAFFAGIFFTSIFTTAIGSAAFVVLGIDGYNPFTVGVVGGIGALVGDTLIFKFVRNDLQADLAYLFRLRKQKSLRKLATAPFLHFLLPILGGFIIASPLPDELGVALLALSHIPTRYFSVLSFLFNALGIALMVRFGNLI